jgi:Protein of unknown function (DUF3046)
MEDHFGAVYATSVARDQVMARLGSRSVSEALEAGEDPKLVWRAVCEHFEIPVSQRH